MYKLYFCVLCAQNHCLKPQFMIQNSNNISSKSALIPQEEMFAYISLSERQSYLCHKRYFDSQYFDLYSESRFCTASLQINIFLIKIKDIIIKIYVFILSFLYRILNIMLTYDRYLLCYI